jgi:hypothetical protein
VRWLVVALLLVACGVACGSRPPPRPADPWEIVDAGGARLYYYPETIERYAPDDAGGYVVRPPPGASAEQRAALIEALAPADPDDIVGDGVVMRLDAAARDAVASRTEVGAVDVLQPADRRGFLWDKDAAIAEVRIELFEGAPDAERDAVGKWLETRGAMVTWRGKAALRARVPQDAIVDVARLGPVRWVE